MKEREIRRLLLSVPAPEEADARRRAWSVVRIAYATREPVSRPHGRRGLAAAAVALAAAALAATVATPPGRAVLNSIRDAIGRERVRGVRRAEPALFRLPASGRLLVESPRGAWVVHADGSKRLLGRYGDVTWSPHGRFVAAVRGHELAALDPRGNIRWTLDRPAAPRLPSWSPGGRVADDTRVAYISGSQLRVVGGDGRGDRALARGVAPVRPSWRPGARHVVAYATRSRAVVVTDVDAIDAPALRRRLPGAAVDVEWSDDGSRLAVASARAVLVFDAGGRAVARRRAPRGARIAAVAFAPRSHVLVETARRGVTSTVTKVASGGALFGGPGRFTALAWSPNGRWLLVAWRNADQWIFIPRAGGAVRAVSNISSQFRATREGAFPTVPPEGWCCGR